MWGLGGTTEGQVSGLLAGLGGSEHSHLCSDLPLTSCRFSKPASALWGLAPHLVHFFEAKSPPWFLLLVVRNSAGCGGSPKLQGFHHQSCSPFDSCLGLSSVTDWLCGLGEATSGSARVGGTLAEQVKGSQSPTGSGFPKIQF